MQRITRRYSFPMPIVRTAARTALGARQVVKDVVRLQEIAQVLARHGLGWLVASVNVPGFGLLRKAMPDISRESPTPERLTAVVRDLGPTFVKLGQILSTRSDLLPPDYVEALTELQDDVGPETYETVREQILNSLGAAPDQLYAAFDPEPLATGSVAQVHRARLHSGEDVAVKVQRPDVRRRIHSDLDLLGFLARQIEVQLPEIRLANLAGVIRTLRRSIADECDFTREAEHMRRFADNFADNPDVIIPTVYESLTKPSVLTMQFLDGVTIKHAREADFAMAEVGERYLAAAFQMLLGDGYFHGDLHPGNVLVLPDGRLGLLDFGMVGRLTEEMRENLVVILVAVQRRDYRTIARVYWEIAIKPDDNRDYTTFEADVQDLMDRHIVGKTMSDVHIDGFVGQLMRTALKHDILVTDAYTMFFKALITTQGMAQQLIPELDPIAEMMPYVQRMARRMYSREHLQDELFYYVMSFRYSARRLPMLVGELVSSLQEGKLRGRLAHELVPADRARLDRVANRLALAAVFSGLILGSVLALDKGPVRLGIELLPATGLSLALLVLYRLWRGIGRSGGV